jgi:hypothetical protein
MLHLRKSLLILWQSHLLGFLFKSVAEFCSCLCLSMHKWRRVLFVSVVFCTGGSGILTPLVIQVCRIYGDMSQSSGTPWSTHRPTHYTGNQLQCLTGWAHRQHESKDVFPDRQWWRVKCHLQYPDVITSPHHDFMFSIHVHVQAQRTQSLSRAYPENLRCLESSNPSSRHCFLERRCSTNGNTRTITWASTGETTTRTAHQKRLTHAT